MSTSQRPPRHLAPFPLKRRLLWKPAHAGELLQCEACERWCHGECPGLTSAQQDAIDRYVCPACAMRDPSLPTVPFPPATAVAAHEGDGEGDEAMQPPRDSPSPCYDLNGNSGDDSFEFDNDDWRCRSVVATAWLGSAFAAPVLATPPAGARVAQAGNCRMRSGGTEGRGAGGSKAAHLHGGRGAAHVAAVSALGGERRFRPWQLVAVSSRARPVHAERHGDVPPSTAEDSAAAAARAQHGG